MSNEKKEPKFNPIKVAVILMIILSVIVLFYLVINLRRVEILTTDKVADLKKNQANDEVNKIKDDPATLLRNNAASAKKVVEEAKKAAIRTVRKIDADDHIWGDIGAPVQLIIYDDFQCPFCADFYDTTEEIKEYFGKNVVIAFRHFPLITHSSAIPAALASECAAEQGKFWEMYNKLFVDNKNGRMNAERFKQDAVDLKLNAAEFNQCLDTEKHKDKVQQQMIEGRNFSVTGTPGNFVNSEPVPGAYPFEDFIGSDGKKREGMKSIIERHLENFRLKIKD